MIERIFESAGSKQVVDDAKAFLDKSRLGDDAQFLMGLAKVAQAFKEAGDVPARGRVDTGGLTIEQIKSGLAVFNDPQSPENRALHDKNDPNHKMMVEKRTKLFGALAAVEAKG